MVYNFGPTANVEPGTPDWDMVLELDYSSGNPDCGISWTNRTIYVPDHANPLELIHEFSHIIAPERPGDINEVESVMLATEYYSSRMLKLSGWTEWMKTYLLSKDGRDWTDCSVWERHQAVRKSLKLAVKAGILTPLGKPTYILPKWFPKHLVDGENRGSA